MELSFKSGKMGVVLVEPEVLKGEMPVSIICIHLNTLMHFEEFGLHSGKRGEIHLYSGN